MHTNMIKILNYTYIKFNKQKPGGGGGGVKFTRALEKRQ